MDYLFKPGSMLGLFADVAEDFIVSDHGFLKTSSKNFLYCSQVFADV